MNVKLNEQDVLCGRGGATNRHNGNIVFRQMVMNQQYSYLAAHKTNKKIIAKSIVDEIRRRGGRFLQYVESRNLADIGDLRANEKTCQALREGMKIRASQKQQDDEMSTAHSFQNLENSFSHSSVTRSYPQVIQPNISRNIDHSQQNEFHYHRHVYSQQNYCQLYQKSYDATTEIQESDSKHFAQPNNVEHKHIAFQENIILNDSNNSLQKSNNESFERYAFANPRHTSNNESFERYAFGNSRHNFEYSPVHQDKRTYQEISYGGLGPRFNINTEQPHNFLSSIHLHNNKKIKYIGGCRCQKIKCLKRYCECFNSGAKCSQNCKCADCENREDWLT